jgi:hypothetical protein
MKIIKTSLFQIIANLLVIYIILAVSSFRFDSFPSNYTEFINIQTFELKFSPLSILTSLIASIVTVTLVSSAVRSISIDRYRNLDIQHANKNLSDIFYTISCIDNNFLSNQKFENTSTSLSTNIEQLALYLQKHYNKIATAQQDSPLPYYPIDVDDKLDRGSHDSQLKTLEDHADFLHFLNNKLTILSGDTFTINRIVSSLLSDKGNIEFSKDKNHKAFIERFGKSKERHAKTFDTLVIKLKAHQQATQNEISTLKTLDFNTGHIKVHKAS